MVGMSPLKASIRSVRQSVGSLIDKDLNLVSTLGKWTYNDHDLGTSSHLSFMMSKRCGVMLTGLTRWAR
ncbi:hypothetical protein VFPPC_16250 [Pochonia chlamydosporia 170]|uniref:Uncharacterized protein n=1 Tax=Pochonia chlamydosporia 170 TaxID=1380566 RepID=A0A179FGU1_METCM|nr:hypothetical protein VFPPC_16250 [Pochonia chlamydosporia 170]OAQ64746.1 hypothetical protein VFPPC_16250 [Pochonia chlamydosporia 170]